MKFVTLALALLLAVGSQAVPLQADAPTMLQNARSVADMYIGNMKASLINSLANIENEEMRRKVKEHLGTVFQGIDTAREHLAPMTDTVVNTAIEGTADLRAGITADIEALKTDIEPLRATLRQVVEKHMAEYRAKFGPIIDEYQLKHNEEMEALRQKLEPLMLEMRDKIPANVEETKTALMPILDAVYGKVQTWVSNAKGMMSPYVTEYREQLTEAAGQLHAPTLEDVNALKNKLEPHAREAGAQIKAMLVEISQALTKA